MATKIIGACLLVVSLFGVLGCASNETEDDVYFANRNKLVSTHEAARLLGCDHDEVAVCIQTNCELEEYYCAPSDDVKKMFRAGEFRYE